MNLGESTGSVTTWTVREIDARAIPGARRPRCLVFENHDVVRRLWAYPKSWQTLAVRALLDLVEDAK